MYMEKSHIHMENIHTFPNIKEPPDKTGGSYIFTLGKYSFAKSTCST